MAITIPGLPKCNFLTRLIIMKPTRTRISPGPDPRENKDLLLNQKNGSAEWVCWVSILCHGDLSLVYAVRNQVTWLPLKTSVGVGKFFLFFGFLFWFVSTVESLRFIHTFPFINSIGRMPARLQCKKRHSLTNQLCQGRHKTKRDRIERKRGKGLGHGSCVDTRPYAVIGRLGRFNGLLR